MILITIIIIYDNNNYPLECIAPSPCASPPAGSGPYDAGY